MDRGAERAGQARAVGGGRGALTAAVAAVSVLAAAALVVGCGSDGASSTTSSTTSSGGGSSNSGGGGGSSGGVTLTGVVAIGRPVAGSVVAIDANGRISSPATTSSAGAYTLDVSGLTAPFLLQAAGTADGRQVFLSSVATAAGQTVNLTSLTDVIVSAAAGSVGGVQLVDLCAPASGSSTAPAACSAVLAAATSGTRLATAVSQVAAMVAPLNTTNTDVLNGAFVANSTGFDALLEKLAYTPASSGSPVATVTLIATQATIGQVTLPSSVGGASTVVVSPPATGDVGTAATAAQALDEIRSCLASFNALYPSSNFSAPSAAQVGAFVDASFDMGGNPSRSGLISDLSSGVSPAVGGFTITASGLADTDLAPYSAAEVTAMGSSTPLAVLRARTGGGSPVTFDSSGQATSAWVALSVSGVGDMRWKMVKGSAYTGCAGGWRMAGPQRLEMHLNARIARDEDSGRIDRLRAFHLEIDEADALSTALGTGTIATVQVRGPGLAAYSGNAASPVGADTPVTISRPTGAETSYQISGAWYGEALLSCADTASRGQAAGTPCVDESRVVPGAVYSWVLRTEGGTLVSAFPYAITAVPLSEAFARANAANIFATLTSATPASTAALRSIVAARTAGSVLDDVFSYSYTIGTAYGAVPDNCHLRLHDASFNLLMLAEADPQGSATGCSFNSAHLYSGSLAAPSPASAIASTHISVALTVLGNQASTGRTLP